MGLEESMIDFLWAPDIIIYLFCFANGVKSFVTYNGINFFIPCFRLYDVLIFESILKVCVHYYLKQPTSLALNL